MQWFGFVLLAVIFTTTYSNDFETKVFLKSFDSKPGRSIVMATLPIRWALCKLASIATGTTREQLLTALNIRIEEVDKCFKLVIEMFNKLSEADLIVFNKIFVNYTEEVDTKFFADSSNSFGVGVESVGFNTPAAAAQFINHKVATVTYSRVKDILTEYDITEDTKIMLLSAVYLKPSWLNYPFEVSKTKAKKFYHMNGLVSDVPMMHMEDFFDINEGPLGTTITIPMKRASMTVVVPKTPKDLQRVLIELKRNPNSVRESWLRVRTQPKILLMPRFKIKTDLDLTDILKKSNLSDIFNSNGTGLNVILKEEHRKRTNMYVSKVKQKLFLEVDEFGASRKDVGHSMLQHFPPSMVQEIVLDRPFYFTVDLDEVSFQIKKGAPVIHHSVLHGVYYGPE